LSLDCFAIGSLVEVVGYGVRFNGSRGRVVENRGVDGWVIVELIGSGRGDRRSGFRVADLAPLGPTEALALLAEDL